MDDIWQTGLAKSAALTQSGGILAQTSPPIAVPSDPASPQAWVTFFQVTLLPLLVNLVGAIAILLLGWLIAAAISAAVRGLLKRTDVDNRIARAVTGGRPGSEGFNIENVLAAVVFWIILILAIVAALNVLNLTTVSQPLNNFLNQIFAFLPKLGAAALLAGVAWVVATLAKTVITRLARSFSLDEKLAPRSPAVIDTTDPNYVSTSAGTPFLLSDTLGNVVYWFVFLFFLPLILGVLDLQGPLQPVQNLLNDLLSALPRIVKAIAIGAVGWFIARTVRDIVTNLLAAAGADRVGAQFGLSRSRGGQSLSWIVGTIVYVLILIPAAIAALDALDIPAISRPATAMLNQILTTLPQIFMAALILIAGYVVGRFVADLVSNILAGVGFNNIFYWLGLQSQPYAPPPSSPPVLGDPEPEAGLPPRDAVTAPGFATRSPSDLIGIITLVGIVLVAAVTATNVLNLPALTAIVSGLLVITGRILSGLVVFAVGLYLANLAFNLLTSSGTSEARILGQAARVAIIILVGAMALQQIGVAPSIVNLAFGLLLGAVAIAIAIAFGLGGRDVAGEQLREWLGVIRRR